MRAKWDVGEADIIALGMCDEAEAGSMMLL
jgi:hypothetical protein